MADEPTLPKLGWNPVTESFSNSRRRKRVLSSPPVSSDPAIFSSDDDPSADNYTQERRKKKYRGPWYQQQLASDSGSLDQNENDQHMKGKRARTFERQYDSGIFMGSDGTDIDEVMENLPTTRGSALSLRPGGLSRSAQTDRPIPSPEELARGQIDRCLEEGEESIDLSSRGLTTLSNATIRPLATFTPVPPVIQGVFSQMEPDLKVFLAANALTTLPGELFKLECLKVLSLRANLFRELPPAIGTLHNLKELNISQNRLRYLPFEILELFSVDSHLESLMLHPNPFYEAKFPTTDEEMKEVHYKIGLGSQTRTRPRRGAICCVPPDLGRRSWHPRWKLTCKARTQVRYLDTNGSLVKGPVFPDLTARGSSSVHKSLLVADASDLCTPPAPRGNHLSRAPSLLEVSLNACSQSSQLPNLPSYLPEDGPAYLPGLLADVAAKKESGGSKCTICKRNFIVARTEWIEWWEIAKILDHKTLAGMASAASPLRQKENERDVLESMVPLIRRGCSWLCVPAKEEAVERAEEQPDVMDVDD
ncbi:Glucose-repressible alcohol dehydrogenase transcriptional effector [Lachnellula cervina]|uniref:Glucose-repressible alcohol dehydrogenase transcriptional effector n=1 Tax=Lachnellula cervina TaxID=1316786 RepID=A0A7D8UNP1_9HELO|nr:Glucose-repressible alcohol dehydrogenase transcriptional effector [Lachnellula cervina]